MPVQIGAVSARAHPAPTDAPEADGPARWTTTRRVEGKSGHGASSLHVRAACAGPRLRHLGRFHAPVRTEPMLFEGAPVPKGGVVAPDMTRPGLGLEFTQHDAERYA